MMKKMQYTIKEYDARKHDKFRALSVKQPNAQRLVTASAEDSNFAEKRIEIKSLNTTYRGDLVICSSALPVVDGLMSGATLGIVELYDVKPIEQFTSEDWDHAMIPPEDRARYVRGYGWFMRNPRRVIEMPVKGQLGIWNLVFTKGQIVEYPRRVVYDLDPNRLQ